MDFKILDRFGRPPYNAKYKAYLTWDNWNDFSFYTLFGLVYMDEKSVKHDIGSVKIGFFGQQEGDRGLSIGNKFEQLGDNFFSLGQSDDYYLILNQLGEQVRDEILVGLNDIARDPELYKQAIEERVTKISLLRYISPTSVTGQFRRMSTGGVRLTSYSFTFSAPKLKDSINEMVLAFNVEPNSFPPTNIHVLIGRNGVGKTNLINNMINSLIEDDIQSTKFGEFTQIVNLEDARLFANLISITFSAFDETEPKRERKDKSDKIQYSYIGLKRIQIGNDSNLEPKSTVMLANEFLKSLNACRISSKINRWKEAIEMLESDPNFKEAEIKSLIELKAEDEFKKSSNDIFKRLSSGHKIVLLTITRLIETLQERSLVLIDEPEAHLHPPLLSAFIRSLSHLLIDTNGVAIIATHSPVVLQEVPKSCIWKLRRNGAEAIAERLQIESFGENVGILTQEIFSLEVTDSGFHKILKELVDTSKTYDEAISILNNQIGLEAMAILRSLFYQKNKIDENNS